MPIPRRMLYTIAVLEQLARLEESHGPNLRVAEIGVLWGNLTARILTWFPHCQVWGIDPWEPYDAGGEYMASDMDFDADHWARAHQIAQARVEKCGGDRCKLLQMTSDQAARELDVKFHLIFDDGLHTFEQVSNDIENWYPLLCSGGRMGGHDLCSRSPGVARALEAIGRPYTTGVGETWWYGPKVRKRSDKLAGEDYRRYWKGQVAKVGLNYVGRPGMNDQDIRDQGQQFWRQLLRVLPSPAGIKVVTEFGCGWGRIANRLRGRYKQAEIWGIDMVPDSIKHGQRAFPQINFFQANFYHPKVPDADLLVTCTCLQHVTDPNVFRRIAQSFQRKVRPGGYFVMFENATPDARCWHMHEMRPEDYVHAFPGFDFEVPILVTDVDPEPHFLLRGRRNGEPVEGP